MSVTSTALRSNVRRGRCAPRRQVGSACSHARGGGGRHRLGWLPVGEGGRPPVGAVRRGGVNRVKATTVAIAGEQRLASDAATFNEWLAAKRANDAQLQVMLVRRVSPEYRTAFAAWLKTAPFATLNMDSSSTNRVQARPGPARRSG
jgi:hypothetical protein